jgi:hypothetical protein
MLRAGDDQHPQVLVSHGGPFSWCNNLIARDNGSLHRVDGVETRNELMSQAFVMIGSPDSLKVSAIPTELLSREGRIFNWIPIPNDQLVPWVRTVAEWSPHHPKDVVAICSVKPPIPFVLPLERSKSIRMTGILASHPLTSIPPLNLLKVLPACLFGLTRIGLLVHVEPDRLLLARFPLEAKLVRPTNNVVEAS